MIAVVIIFFVILTVWCVSCAAGGSDWNNKSYWATRSQKERNRANRLFEKAGSTHRV
jgi:hypothetical protein